VRGHLLLNQEEETLFWIEWRNVSGINQLLVETVRRKAVDCPMRRKYCLLGFQAVT